MNYVTHFGGAWADLRVTLVQKAKGIEVLQREGGVVLSNTLVHKAKDMRVLWIGGKVSKNRQIRVT